MNKKLPNFLVAGFPKCGTTSLYYYLSEHPEIFLPKQKELHFFTQHVLSKNHKKENKELKKTFIKDIESYQNLYKLVSNEKSIGDISPSYIVYPSSVSYIKKYLGADVKIIIVIRDPIQRTFSNYLHAVREYREDKDFYSAILDESRREEENYTNFLLYTFSSFYASRIKEFKREFEEVLVLTQEELLCNTKDKLTEIYRFLGIDQNYIPKNLNTKFNEGGVFSDNVITRLILKPNPIRSWLTRNLRMTSLIKRIKKRILKNHQKPSPQIDKKSEDYLINLFKEDVLKLKDMGIDVNHWNAGFFKKVNE